jgi:hypothetical protein
LTFWLGNKIWSGLKLFNPFRLSQMIGKPSTDNHQETTQQETTKKPAGKDGDFARNRRKETET